MRTGKESLQGFTLIEVLLAIFLWALVGGAVYSLFSQGLKLWKRSSQSGIATDALFYLEKMESDLRNAIPIVNNQFLGEKDSFEFYTLGFNQSFANEKELIRVRYLFDEASQNIRRYTGNYLKILNEDKNLGLSEGVSASAVRCEYNYHYSDANKNFEWLNKWQEKCLPDAVKVFIEYRDKNQIQNISKVILIPQGGCKG